jgi:phenylacetate-CoA ligase
MLLGPFLAPIPGFPIFRLRRIDGLTVPRYSVSVLQATASTGSRLHPDPSAFESVRREVTFAFDNVQFFHNHMVRAGLTPADITDLSTFAAIPPTEKSDYRRNFPAHVLARGRSLNNPGVVLQHSAGTDTDRLISVVHTTRLAVRMATCIAINPNFEFLVRPRPGGVRTVRYGAPNCSDVECSSPNSTMADRLIMGGGTLILPVYHDLLTTPDTMLDRAAREIEEFDPQILYVDSNHLAFLARRMRQRGIKPPRVGRLAIAASYTYCTALNRRQIREFFSDAVPFASTMAMSEFGLIGLECLNGRMHLNNRDYFLEMVTDGRWAEPNEIAELYITSLGDTLSPHIRYRTGDMYRLPPASCSCGSPLPSVLIEGRRRNMFYRADRIQMTPRELDDLLGVAEWTDLCQLEQLGEDRFTFRFIPSDKGNREQEVGTFAKIEKALGPGVKLSIERTPYIPCERSGKLQWCKSAIAERPEPSLKGI